MKYETQQQPLVATSSRVSGGNNPLFCVSVTSIVLSILMLIFAVVGNTRPTGIVAALVLLAAGCFGLSVDCGMQDSKSCMWLTATILWGVSCILTVIDAIIIIVFVSHFGNIASFVKIFCYLALTQAILVGLFEAYAAYSGYNAYKSCTDGQQESKSAV